MGEAKERGANPLKLRQRIDTGQTGDKVDFPDPAAAPLGTDDEASGNPISHKQLRMALSSEVKKNAEKRHSNGGKPKRSRRDSADT